MTPQQIAKNLLTQYPLTAALDRTESPAVRAAIRLLAGVKPEIPARKVNQPAASRVV